MKKLVSVLALAAALSACDRASAPGGESPASPPPVTAPTPGPAPAAPPTSEDADLGAPVGPVPTPPAEPAASTPAPQATDDWRATARPADAARLRRLDDAWTTGLSKTPPVEVVKLGRLGDPTTALRNPHPAPGAYRCRTVKMGGIVGFTAYPWFRCEVELTPGGDLVVRKTTGSQRTMGLLYPRDDTSLVYLGGQSLGNETTTPRYGENPERDQVGVFTRIGDGRYRLALPWPLVESDLDLIELARLDLGPPPPH